MNCAPAYAVALLAIAACKDASPVMRDNASAGADQVVDITARGRTLQAPAEIPAGWTTVRLHNESAEEHFVVFERLPAGKTVADSRSEVVPVFQEGLDLLNAGKQEEAFAAFGKLPAWYAEVVMFGGPGIVSGGRTAQTALDLQPGTYAIECYVKTGGRFHSADGMLAQVIVTETPGGGQEPRASLELTVADDGIAMAGVPSEGTQRVRVHFEDQKIHEHFLGTDVHLARLTADGDTTALAEWMNWVAPQGLATPAPATFLGGTQEMPAGNTAYFTASLTPGRYAFVAEVPDPLGKGMLLPFSVPDPDPSTEAGR